LKNVYQNKNEMFALSFSQILNSDISQIKPKHRQLSYGWACQLRPRSLFWCFTPSYIDMILNTHL